MPKIGTPGYLVPKAAYLSSIALPANGQAVVVADKKCWFMKNSTLRPIPQTFDSSINSDVTTITISTATYEIDFTQCARFIDITLAANTELSLVNLNEGQEFFIRINWANYTISNLWAIAAFASLYDYTSLLTNRTASIFRATYDTAIRFQYLFSEVEGSEVVYQNNTINTIFEMPLS